MASDKSKRKTQRPLSAEEARLWNKVKNTVTAIRDSEFQISHEEAEIPVRSSKIEDVLVLTAAATKPTPVNSKHVLTQLDRKTKGKIAKGRNVVEGTIDLHGMRQAEAHAALLRFLRGAQQRGARFVIVVTGKGTGNYRETGEVHREVGVLKVAVPNWFATEAFRELVIGYTEASRNHGGSGALYVQIRQRKSQIMQPAMSGKDL